MGNFLERLSKLPAAEFRQQALESGARYAFDGFKYSLLFEILDDREYRQVKIQFDPSTTLYAQDLDLGRRAASWEEWTYEEGLTHLPRLWQYTFLRGGLTSQADEYPVEAFRLLILLGRKQEALDLAELLASRAKKITVFCEVARQLRMQG